MKDNPVFLGRELERQEQKKAEEARAAAYQKLSLRNEGRGSVQYYLLVCKSHLLPFPELTDRAGAADEGYNKLGDEPKPAAVHPRGRTSSAVSEASSGYNKLRGADDPADDQASAAYRKLHDPTPPPKRADSASGRSASAAAALKLEYTDGYNKLGGTATDETADDADDDHDARSGSHASEYSAGYNKLHGTDGMPPPPATAAAASHALRRETRSGSQGSDYSAGYNKLQGKDEESGHATLRRDGRLGSQTSEFSAGYNKLQGKDDEDDASTGGNAALRRASEYTAGYNKLQGTEDEPAHTTLRRDGRLGSHASEYSAGYNRLQGTEEEAPASATLRRDGRRGSPASEHYHQMAPIHAGGGKDEYTDGYHHLAPSEEAEPATLRRKSIPPGSPQLLPGQRIAMEESYITDLRGRLSSSASKATSDASYTYVDMEPARGPDTSRNAPATGFARRDTGEEGREQRSRTDG